MPPKNEKPIAYVISEDGKLHELEGIERLESGGIEPANGKIMVFPEFEEYSLSISINIPRTFFRFVQGFMANNWLKRHGYPMRRKGGKYESICNY